MKKLTIAVLVVSAIGAVPKIFRNSFKHCRNFEAAGVFCANTPPILFLIPKTRFLATRVQEGQIKT
jgi:hypothetical protein